MLCEIAHSSDYLRRLQQHYTYNNSVFCSFPLYALTTLYIKIYVVTAVRVCQRLYLVLFAAIYSVSFISTILCFFFISIPYKYASIVFCLAAYRPTEKELRCDTIQHAVLKHISIGCHCRSVNITLPVHMYIIHASYRPSKWLENSFKSNETSTVKGKNDNYFSKIQKFIVQLCSMLDDIEIPINSFKIYEKY